MVDKLCVGSSQPRLHCDEALFEVLKGNAIERSCDPQRVFASGIAKTVAAPILAVVRSLSESRCRNEQFRVGLKCRF